MEEIMKKNIFSEKHLAKLSPDYSPQDIILRMQLRREGGRDTHNNGLFKCSGHAKKSIRKTKANYNLKKEIVKLRSHFHNMNLQNEIKFKDSNVINKTRSTFKEQTFRRKVDESVEKEVDLYIKNYGENKNDLTIENDAYFKIKPKGFTDHLTNYISIENSKKILTLSDEILKTPRNALMSANEQSSTQHNAVHQYNEHKTDLQSLLIMMAINSKDENKNMEFVPTTKNCDEETKSVGDTHFNNTNNSTTKVQIKADKADDLAIFLNIKPLKIELNSYQKYIAKKIIIKWKVFVSSRVQNRMYEQRKQTLDNFFDKLSRKTNHANHSTDSVQKAKTLARDFSTYQHRYKIQKHIIALQKAKLEEQNKVIEQLKYNKIIEASRQSLDTMREDVRRTYYEIDKHLKPKIKCLTNELKIKEFEEPSLVLHCLKVPQFLQRMEARARERDEKHAIIRERRKQMEEERIRLKQQAELAKAEMDKEEKMRRMKDLREKRKKEKIENIRKKQHAERMRALTVMADLHYERNLMNKYGLKPLKLLLQIKKDNIDRANTHYKFQLMKNLFLHWMWYTEDMWFDRNYKAEDFYRKKILKNAFRWLKMNHYEYVLKKQVADDYYDLYVTQLVFRKWREGIIIIKKEFELKWEKATLYYNSNILFRTFTCWRSLPALNALKREQDARKLKWREKVLLVVPDYQPPED